MRVHQNVLSIFSSLFFLLLWTGCKNKVSEPPATQVTSTASQVHVAFAGGGWRAHTGHAAWTIALLQHGDRSLTDAFANVGALSSNSGGSWFSTMLMFSAAMDADIAAPNAISTWATSGWLGKQQADFDNAGCNGDSGFEYLRCVADKYTNSSEGFLYWNSVVNDLIFKDYPLDPTLTLSGARQPWAANKSLLVAATLLTNGVVINEDGLDQQYYQTCLAPSQPVLKGDNNASCTNGLPADVTPVRFSGLPQGSNLKPLPFLAELGSDNNSSVFNAGYTRDASWSRNPVASASIQLPLSSGAVPAITAAAASSAAAGFGASEHVTGTYEVSYGLSDEALSFQLANATVQFVDASDMSLNELANNQVVQLADGGPVDNSAVAQLVSFLQLNNQANGFSIVAFDNVQAAYQPGGNAANVGVDIASLFGQTEKFCFDTDIGTYCVATPNVQIFDQGALTSTPATWSTPLSNGQQLVYTKYTVTTVANTVMGISAGSVGTLHAFTCVYPSAPTVPSNGDTDFQAYAAMLNFIYTGLNQNNQEGLNYLLTAFGLNQ